MKNPERFIELRNTDRIKAVIQKLENKEPVSFVFFGGSITSGYQVKREECFARILEDWINANYPDCDLSIYNLGIAGSPSIFGLYQCIQYVNHYAPDLVFIEYAINDTKNFDHQAAFESLLSYCLSLKKNPGVVLLLAKSKVGYTCQNYMDMVGEHYHQTSVFISTASVEIPWEEYSDDYGHPNPSGHRFIADLLITMFQMVHKSALTKEPLPNEPFYNKDFIHLSFFNERWNYEGNRKNPSITFTANCRYLYILYFLSIDESYGNAELIVDGEVKEILSGFRINNWDHLFGHIIELGETQEDHTVCFKMQKGEEDKLFSLQNLGYC